MNWYQIMRNKGPVKLGLGTSGPQGLEPNPNQSKNARETLSLGLWAPRKYK